MKTCTMCKRDLPPESFPRSKKGKDGLNPRCRECLNTLQRQWRKGGIDELAAPVPEKTSPPKVRELRVKAAPALQDRDIVEIVRLLERGGLTPVAIAARFDVTLATVIEISTGKHRRANELRQAIGEGKPVYTCIDWMTLETPALNKYRRTNHATST
jgi:hypothetical protein